MAQTQQQYQAIRQGGPFELASVPIVKPKADEITVRLKAVALNPIDWKQLDMGIMVESWPAVFGSDCAGIVEAVGDEVKTFSVGDQVFGWGNGFRETTTAPSYRFAKKPSTLTFEQAASLPICYHTAALAVYKLLEKLPGASPDETSASEARSILVLGGSSAVGGAAIQILRNLSPSATILATSSVSHHSRLTSLGATRAFDRNFDDLIKDIKQASPDGHGVQMILDAVGGAAARPDVFDSLSTSSARKYAEVFQGMPTEVPEGIEGLQVFGNEIFNLPGGKEALPTLAKLIESGEYKLPVPVSVVGTGFEAIGKGLEELKKGVSGSKLVVTL